jgi:hypothetical protein
LYKMDMGSTALEDGATGWELLSRHAERSLWLHLTSVIRHKAEHLQAALFYAELEAGATWQLAPHAGLRPDWQVHKSCGPSFGAGVSQCTTADLKPPPVGLPSVGLDADVEKWEQPKRRFKQPAGEALGVSARAARRTAWAEAFSDSEPDDGPAGGAPELCPKGSQAPLLKELEQAALKARVLVRPGGKGSLGTQKTLEQIGREAVTSGTGARLDPRVAKSLLAPAVPSLFGISDTFGKEEESDATVDLEEETSVALSKSVASGDLRTHLESAQGNFRKSVVAVPSLFSAGDGFGGSEVKPKEGANPPHHRPAIKTKLGVSLENPEVGGGEVKPEEGASPPHHQPTTTGLSGVGGVGPEGLGSAVSPGSSALHTPAQEATEKPATKLGVSSETPREGGGEVEPEEGANPPHHQPALSAKLGVSLETPKGGGGEVKPEEGASPPHHQPTTAQNPAQNPGCLSADELYFLEHKDHVAKELAAYMKEHMLS